MPNPLSTTDHSRDSAGLRYVYPVVSRRARGVSVGINLNVNNACNWACVYCQVPDLVRGGPPPVDLALLEHEVRDFLDRVLTGDFMVRNVPADARQLRDVAFSGNGEPTGAAEFSQAVDVVVRVMADLDLLSRVKVRLITNGSLLHRAGVRRGICRIGELDGEVWFKVDRTTAEGLRAVNRVRVRPETVRRNLERTAALAPTWVQTCWFRVDGQIPSATEADAYLRFIGAVKDSIRGVHLYGLARPSMQPAADRLSAATPEELQAFATRIAATGVRVDVSP